MKMIAGLILSVALLGPMQAHAQTPGADPALSADALEDVVVTARRSGAPMWEITRGGSTLILVGDLIGTPDDLDWRPDALEAATARVQRVMTPPVGRVSGSDFLRLISIGHAELLDQAEPIAFVVTRMDTRFRAAARIDDALIVRTLYEAIQGPRLIIRQTITRGDQVLTQADVEAACIDLKGRPRRPPEALRNALASWLLP